MTNSLSFGSMVRIYRAGNTLWNAWVTFQGARTWANFRQLLGEIMNFADVVNTAAPALAPAVGAALLAAAGALRATVAQLRFDFSHLRLD
ncbi:MAG: hypothetical protein WBA97_13870 [Actinophytocola sp.]|uniref:hypothetical protein n=1 Tax=Actinophytocola sp. TaxID=1872138 RepID=UPI003C74B939